MRVSTLALVLLSACFSADVVKQRGVSGNSCLPDGACFDGLVCNANKCTQACVSASECLAGEVCVAGVCVTNVLDTSCSPDCTNGQTCVSGRCVCVEGGNCAGCCVANVCIVDINAQSCGKNGSLCNNCSGLTPSCVDGACTAACDANVACASGCCNANGCDAGETPSACGKNGGACVDCNTSPDGAACKNGVCGCNTEADCPSLQACTAGVCSPTCSATSPCRDGCCNASGVCVSGVDDASCGGIGAGCKDCTTGTEEGGRVCDPNTRSCGCEGAQNAASCANINAGNDCISGLCGCVNDGDCLGGFTCTGTAGGRNKCVPLPCDGVTTTCPGSCCNAFHLCQGPSSVSSASACGTDSLSCLDCSAAQQGRVCIAGGCGCNTTADCAAAGAGHELCDVATHTCVACFTAADCASGQACNTTTHTCSSSCGAGHTACKDGCCDGANCVAGTANALCGSVGGACVNCANDGDCSPSNPCTCDDTVGGGFCSHTGCDTGSDRCAAGCCVTGGGGTCNAGTSNATCGQAPAANGACGACTGTATCNDETQLCQASGCGVSTSGDGDICAGAAVCCGGSNVCAANVVGTCDCNTTDDSDCVGNNNGTDCLLNVFPNHCGCDQDNDCASATNGSRCRAADDKCGCDIGDDCDPGERCLSATHRCDPVPGGGSCAQGSCNGCCAGGSCVAGTSASQCGSVGPSGGTGNIACAVCSSSAAGDACVSTGGVNHCGCTTASDCNPGEMCDTTTDTCVAGNTGGCDLTATKLCNGCCSGGNCIAPSVANDAQCATTVPTAATNVLCVNCGTVNNEDCVDVNADNVPPFVCGCDAAADCGGATPRCNLTLKQCVACDRATDCAPGEACSTNTGTCVPGAGCSSSSLCNGCCNAGFCVSGSSNTACLDQPLGSSNVTCHNCTIDAFDKECVVATRLCGCENPSADAACGGALPRCKLTAGGTPPQNSCVACTANSHCTTGTGCVGSPSNGVCENSSSFTCACP